MTAAAVLLMLCLTVFAFGTVNYGAKKSKQTEIAAKSNMSYSLPRIAPVLARAEAAKPENELPQMLIIKERFPNYDGGPRPIEPGDDSSGGAEEEEDDAPRAMVILDDLRAAPPKSMFVKAVFENNDEKPERDRSRKWVTQKVFDDFGDLCCKPGKKKRKKKIPPIPEPGTGVMLGLGLTLLAGWRQGDRSARTRASAAERTPGGSR